MRTLKLLSLVAVVLTSTAIRVQAQAAPPAPVEQTQAPAPPPQDPVPPPPVPPPGPAPQAPSAAGQDEDEMYFFHVSLGGQAGDQTFTDSSTFVLYNEPGAVAAAHSIGGGTLFDVSAGMRLWKDFGVGLAYSSISNKNDAVVSALVPHPIVFGQPRTATATASDLEHTENVVHLQFMWMLPRTERFQIFLMGGPSFFTVRQTLASLANPAQQISDIPPFTSVTIAAVTLTEVKDSPVGFNIGADGTYFIRRVGPVNVGVGGFVRFTRASLDLPAPAGITRDEDLEAGGAQGALGLRLRF